MRSASLLVVLSVAYASFSLAQQVKVIDPADIARARGAMGSAVGNHWERDLP